MCVQVPQIPQPQFVCTVLHDYMSTVPGLGVHTGTGKYFKIKNRYTLHVHIPGYPVGIWTTVHTLYILILKIHNFQLPVCTCTIHFYTIASLFFFFPFSQIKD